MKLWVAIFAASIASGQAIDPATLNDKVLLGYQGWFRCPGGGSIGSNWSHWTSSGAPTAASLVIDMYPDLREWDAGEGCVVPGMNIGDKPALLFSSAHPKTVDRHFRWMQEYGLDGVLVQRFVTDIPGLRSAGDPVIKNIVESARRYGRVFAIEYDISGANAATVLTVLQQDWKYLNDTFAITEQPGYLRHNGKPVVSVWGIGLNDGRHPPADPLAALELIRWFQEEAQVTYIGGTPAYWRTLSNDAYADSRWAATYQAMDVIQPWAVGRYARSTEVDNWKTNRLAPDIAITSQRQQAYMPVIFPGFSWYNLNRTAAQNQIPRLKGQFLWQQAYNAKSAGARMLKIAMFDEVNESTAMFKLASRRKDAPEQGFWLTLDADSEDLSSDWYLRLAGEITRMFHGETGSAALPARPGPPWPAADGTFSVHVVNAANRGTTVAPESLVSVDGSGDSMTWIDSSGAGWEMRDGMVPAAVAPGPAAVVARRDGVVTYGEVTVAAVAPGMFAGEGVVRVVSPDGAETVSRVAVCSGNGLCEGNAIDLGPMGSTATFELPATGVRRRSALDAVACSIGDVAVEVHSVGRDESVAGLDRVVVSLPRILEGRGLVDVRVTVDGVEANVVQVVLQ